jgi:hypothetical protein
VKITHKEVSMGSDGLFDRVKTQWKGRTSQCLHPGLWKGEPWGFPPLPLWLQDEAYLKLTWAALLRLQVCFGSTMQCILGYDWSHEKDSTVASFSKGSPQRLGISLTGPLPSHGEVKLSWLSGSQLLSLWNDESWEKWNAQHSSHATTELLSGD